MNPFRLRIAVLSVLVTAAILFLLLQDRRRTPPALAPQAADASSPAEVRVLYGRDEGRDALLRRRFAAPARALFADRTLLETLRGPAFPPDAAEVVPQFVEAWIVHRGAADATALGTPPRVTTRQGRTFELAPLDSFVRTPSTSAARLTLAAFSAGAGRPLGKGSLRRVVYALPPGIAYDDVASAVLDGLALAPAAAAVDALDAWPDDPSRDVAAFLKTTATRRLAQVGEGARPEDDR